MENNLQNLLMQLNILGQQIGSNNQLLLQNVEQMIRKSEIQNRKKRRSEIGKQLVVSGNLYLSINKFFDDGQNELKAITNRLTGKNIVYTIYFKGLEKTEKFGIYFENEGVWVIGSKNKVKSSYLFDCFVKAAGPFLPGFSHKMIGDLLYDWWALSIERTENQLSVPVFAGWNDGDFLHKDNYMFRKTTEFPPLPVFEKEFKIAKFSENTPSIYFSEMQKISRWKDRLLIALYPFHGILSSILFEMHCFTNISLNFVEVDPIDRRIVCSWLKIFNRSFLLPYTLNQKEGELRNLMKRSRDEILIFDAGDGGEMNDYFRRKIKKNLHLIIEGMKHQGAINEEMRFDSCYSCAFFSRERILEEGVENILIDSEFYKNDQKNIFFVEYNVMESVLSDFVSYVKNNMEDVWNTIIKKTKEEGKNEQAISAIFEIVDEYWSKKGVDFTEALKVPSNIVWREILSSKTYDEEEFLEIFISAVRKYIHNFYAIKKVRDGEFRHSSFFYSDDHIWIPTKILRLILTKEGLMPYMNDILLILREKKHLVTDKNGFSKKLQLSGNSIETYQIERKFFNRSGLVDIVDLAKGDNV